MKVRKKPEKFLLPHGMPSDARELAFSSRVPPKALKIKAPYKSWHYQTILIVLTVSSKSTMPGVCPFNYPALLQGRKAFRARETCLHFDVPVWTMLSHPGVQSVIVILLIRKDRHETRKVVWGGLPEQERGRHTIIKPRTGNEHGQSQAQRIDQQMPLTPLNLLAAIISPLRTSHLGGLDRLTINAHGTARGCAPRSRTGPLAQDLDHLGPCPIIAPLDKVVIDRTLGQHIVRQHIPLAATAIQVEQCIQDFPHIDLPRAPSSWA